MTAADAALRCFLGRAAEGGGSEGKGPDWAIKQQRRQSGAFRSMLAVAVSSDGRYLAAGGGSRAVHIWDVRTSQCIKSFASHKVRGPQLRPLCVPR